MQVSWLIYLLTYREAERQRVRSYQQDLHEIKQRVNQRPLLFEQAAQVCFSFAFYFIRRRLAISLASVVSVLQAVSKSGYLYPAPESWKHLNGAGWSRTGVFSARLKARSDRFGDHSVPTYGITAYGREMCTVLCSSETWHIYHFTYASEKSESHRNTCRVQLCNLLIDSHQLMNMPDHMADKHDITTSIPISQSALTAYTNTVESLSNTRQL